jgi:hypothetical protein
VKRLTKKEAEKLQTMRMGFRSRVRAELEGMEVGEIRLLTKEEWTRPTQPPYHMLRQIEKALRRRYTCGRLLDGSGWVVERSE